MMACCPESKRAEGVPRMLCLESRVYDNVQEMIGHTPMVRVHAFELPEGVEIYAKLEFMNRAHDSCAHPAGTASPSWYNRGTGGRAVCDGVTP